MKKLLIPALLAASLAGCDSTGAEHATKVNRLCKPHGGVISTDYHGGIIICADKIARDTR